VSHTNSDMQELSILDSMHATERASLKGSEIVCESPLCGVRFPADWTKNRAAPVLF
jgi:hypothetical protein